MKIKREGRKPEREGRKAERGEKWEGLKPGLLLVSMGRIGKDRTKMKHYDRYPKLQLRIRDELLFKIEKEIEASGMNTSQILTKALNEYFERSKELEN